MSRMLPVFSPFFRWIVNLLYCLGPGSSLKLVCFSLAAIETGRW